MRFITCSVLALVFLVGACSSDKPEETVAASKGIAILEPTQNYEPETAVEEFNYEIPAPAINSRWAQAGGNTAHSLGNLALSLTPSKAWSSDIGNGSSANAKLLAAPLIVDGIVFAQDAKGYVSAYTLGSGSRLWRVNTAPSRDDGQAMGGGIAWDKDVLYVTTGYGEVLALRAQNGGELWRQGLGSPLRSAPTVAEGRVFVISLENETHVLEAKTGRVIWRHRGIAESASLLGSASPAVKGDTVIVPYSSGEIFGLRTQNGRLSWSEVLAVSRQVGSLPAIADIRGLPVVEGKRIFAISHSGRLAAIDERTGDRVWEKDIGGINTPCVVGQGVFVVTNDNHLVAMTRQNGKIIWSTQLPKQEDPLKTGSKALSWFGPVMAGGRLWLTNSKGELNAYSVENGLAAFTKQVADSFYLPPVIADQTMILLSDDGNLIALK